MELASHEQQQATSAFTAQQQQDDGMGYRQQQVHVWDGVSTAAGMEWGIDSSRYGMGYRQQQVWDGVATGTCSVGMLFPVF